MVQKLIIHITSVQLIKDFKKIPSANHNRKLNG